MTFHLLHQSDYDDACPVCAGYYQEDDVLTSTEWYDLVGILLVLFAGMPAAYWLIRWGIDRRRRRR